jgi:hypothetical protein
MRQAYSKAQRMSAAHVVAQKQWRLSGFHVTQTRSSNLHHVMAPIALVGLRCANYGQRVCMRGALRVGEKAPFQIPRYVVTVHTRGRQA